MLGRSQGKQGCDILIICPKYIPVKCKKRESQPRTTKQFLTMLIDHSSAAFFLLELPQMTYKYYNNVAKQVQHLQFVQVSITMVSLYQACGGSSPKQKITMKLPTAWRIIPVSKWLVTPIYKPFSPFGRGITLHRELTNHGY